MLCLGEPWRSRVEGGRRCGSSGQLDDHDDHPLSFISNRVEESAGIQGYSHVDPGRQLFHALNLWKTELDVHSFAAV